MLGLFTLNWKCNRMRLLGTLGWCEYVLHVGCGCPMVTRGHTVVDRILRWPPWLSFPGITPVTMLCHMAKGFEDVVIKIMCFLVGPNITQLCEPFKSKEFSLTGSRKNRFKAWEDFNMKCSGAEMEGSMVEGLGAASSCYEGGR